jgi:acetolactate synthase small subunit
MMIAKHYYEAHITIEPIFDDRLLFAKHMAERRGFNIASLLMKKREEDTEQRSQYDTFMTAHSKSSIEIEHKIIGFVHALQAEGFKVWRYKIEDIVMDSRINDTLSLLGE